MAKDSNKLVMLLGHRGELVTRLAKSLEHLPADRQIAVITSYMSITELTKLVEFQEQHLEDF